MNRKMKIDMKDWKKKLGCYMMIEGILHKWLGGTKWRRATKEEQIVRLIPDDQTNT